MLAVAAHERDAVREVVKTRRDAEKLLRDLISDLALAGGQLRANYASQFCRRTAIRTLAATVDGIVFCLKRVARANAGVFNHQFTESEEFLLSERQPANAAKKPRFPGFADNIKETFRMFAKIHRGTCSTDFGQHGFQDLCKTYDIRNRVMHPKTHALFAISDDETKTAGAALAWLQAELTRLAEDSKNSIGANPKT
jgi:hypothetical protein